MKKFLIVYYGDTPECVEGFDEKCERSCKGALHINPGRQLTVSEDELKHIKAKYKHMLPKLRILSEKCEAQAKQAEPKGNVAEPESKEAASLKEAPSSDSKSKKDEQHTGSKKKS